MCNYISFVSVLTLYYSSDVLSSNVLIYDLWHEDLVAGLAQWVQHYVVTIEGYKRAEFGTLAQLQMVAHVNNNFEVLEHDQRRATK